jgi:hypothetical protein
VWGRITGLERFNPFLPAEAAVELADEGLDLLDTVLSSSRDQVEGTVLVLGCTSETDYRTLRPLNYPVQPGALVTLPPATAVKTILTGEETDTHRMKIGTLIGRRDVDVSLRTNMVVARHMALLAMTGGGKTVAARRIIRELLNAGYPLVVLDPHGDYLEFWKKRHIFRDNEIMLFYPHLNVNDQNRDMIAFLVSRMTQGFTDPQKEKFNESLESISIGRDERLSIVSFIGRLLQDLANREAKHPGTIPAVRRALRFVQNQMEAMDVSNELLRKRMPQLSFGPMPDPTTEPEELVSPGRMSIIYLGGYDHLTQSTIVSLLLKHLFEVRASMRDKIPPFLAVVEEAHNFIPSWSEGQAETPSLEIIRKVITEGRKFGVGLLLISQRPSRLDETTLSQCNTFMVFRLVNPRDQGFVEKVMENLTKADSKLLPGFGPGQGIISGQAVRFPLVIQVDFDKDLVPESMGDESFVEIAQKWKERPTWAAVERSREIEEQLEKIQK